MEERKEAVRMTLECDGDEYEVARAAIAEGPAAQAGACWVVRARGYTVGRFPVADDQSEAQIRETACYVIRHGSTTTFPCPPES